MREAVIEALSAEFADAEIETATGNGRVLAYLAAHAAFNRKRPITARACVVIEDSLPGLAAARAAGMPCVMLTTSHPADTLRQRGAALVWDSLTGHTAAELAAL